MSTSSLLTVLAPALLLLAGCPPVPELPEAFDVNLAAEEKQSAGRDTGPAALADSSWAVFRKADPGEPAEPASAPGPYGGLLHGGTVLARPPVDGQIFVTDFGDAGQMTAIHEIGDTSSPSDRDRRWHLVVPSRRSLRAGSCNSDLHFRRSPGDR